MSVKEEIHRLVDHMDEDQAKELLDDLRNAADIDAEPLSQEESASLQRGLADIKAGRFKSLEEYKRERGL